MRGGSGVPVYLFPQLTAFYPTHSVSGRIMEHGISPFSPLFTFFVDMCIYPDSASERQSAHVIWTYDGEQNNA